MALILEVADTSLDYAREVIPEVWIVDLQSRKVEVYAEPGTSTGGYREIREIGPGEQIRSGAVEGLSLKVDDFLT